MSFTHYDINNKRKKKEKLITRHRKDVAVPIAAIGSEGHRCIAYKMAKIHREKEEQQQQQENTTADGDKLYFFEIDVSKLNISRGKVEGVEVDVLRDSGCTIVVVKKSLVPKSKFTGKESICLLANGLVYGYPEAIINVKSRYFTGKTRAICMPNPIVDLIIGLIDGSTDGKNEAAFSPSEILGTIFFFVNGRLRRRSRRLQR